MKIKATFKMLTDEYLPKILIDKLCEVQKITNKSKSVDIEVNWGSEISNNEWLKSVAEIIDDIIMIYSDEYDFFNNQLICISKNNQWWEVHNYKKDVDVKTSVYTFSEERLPKKGLVEIIRDKYYLSKNKTISLLFNDAEKIYFKTRNERNTFFSYSNKPE